MKKYIFPYILCYLITFCLIAYYNDDIVSRDYNYLAEILLIIIYILIIIIGIVSNKLLEVYVFLIFAFPSYINRLLPSYYLGDKYQIGATEFPLVHVNEITIFIFIVILYIKNYRYLKNSNYIPSYTIIAILIVYLGLIKSFLNIEISSSSLSLALIGGMYQIRILLGTLILINIQPNFLSMKKLINGITICIIFLAIESTVYSGQFESIRLTSGTLGNNVFANIISILVVLIMIFYNKNAIQNKKFILLGILFGGYIVLLTGSRSASFVLISCFFVLYYRNFNIKNKNNLFGGVLLLAILFSGIIYNSDLILTRYADSLNDIMVLFYSEGNSINSSIVTRFNIWNSSLRMIFDNPIIGIGNGTWDLMKHQYGIEYEELLDSHNDYLAIFSQNGIIIGLLFFALFVYIPIRYFLKNRNRYCYLFSYTFILFLLGLTNSNLQQPYVYTLSCLIILGIFNYSKIDE